MTIPNCSGASWWRKPRNSEAETKEEVAGELADVLYFAMARAVKAGVSIDDAVAVLDSRTRKVTRRKGDAKTFRIEAGDKILGTK